MNTKWLLVTTAVAGLCALTGCAKSNGPSATGKSGVAQSEDAPEPGETKVRLNQTPPAVRATIERALAGGELEDIAMKQQGGKTVYETDIIKNGHKWELLVAADGSILHNVQEGSAEEKAVDAAEKIEAGWRGDFNVNKANLMPTGNNPYLSIQPGKVTKMKSGIDTLTVTILPETKVIDGVKVGVLQERETKDGKLIEISFNYFATDKESGDVYYFGEDVDNYKDGKVINHESAWHAGEKGARFGLMIPGKPTKGDKYYQEIAPKVALDRVEIVSTDETVKTPAGTFEHCLHLKETTPLEADVSHKYYAPGLGMIKDDEFELAEKP